MLGNSRDVGLSHGPGKGSAPRNNHSKIFRENFDAIAWGEWTDPVAFESDPRVRRKGNKIIKRYK